MDLLSTPAWKWQVMLQAGETTSYALTQECIEQIKTFNKQNLCLNAIITVTPLEPLLAQAQKLDIERPSGLRSPLHGIPIVLKDIFITDAALGMPTTCGAVALASAVGRKNCPVVENLLAAGLIILGKANLTEFCGLRSENMRLGLSSLGGQTQSPFVRGGLDETDVPLGNTHAGGSSSGSAVSVAAGFAPIAIGSETSGSLVVPANRAGLYSLKVTNARATPMCSGMHKLSSYYDSIGAMTKSARDLVDIIRVLTGIPGDYSCTCDLSTSFEGFKLGFVDPNVWRYPDDLCHVTPEARKQLANEYDEAISRIAQANGHVVTGIQLPETSCLSHDGKSIIQTVAFSEIPKLMEGFLQSLDESPVQNLTELIEWNKANPKRSMPEPCPDQEDLIKALHSTLDPAEKESLFTLGSKRAYEDGIDRALRENDVELLIGPADSTLFMIAAAAGCPIATMPLTMVKFDNRGSLGSRPDGLCVIGRRNSDERILDFLLSYEVVFPFNPTPRDCLIDNMSKDE